MDANDDIFTPSTAADYLHINVRTVRNFIRDGRLRAARVGRAYRIRRAWLDEFLDFNATVNGGNSDERGE